MEMLVVDVEGGVFIPPDNIRKLGFNPGDQIALVQTTDSLIVCNEGVALLEEWWNSLSDEDKIEARKEADWYESLSEEERDAIWNADSEELERWLEGNDEDEDDKDPDDEGDKGDEYDLSPVQRSVG